MNEIIIAMMLWISNVTGYAVPEIPNIKYLNTMEFILKVHTIMD